MAATPPPLTPRPMKGPMLTFSFSISLLLFLFVLFYLWLKISLFPIYMFDFGKDWRSGFGFRFERWDFVLVFGLVLACGHDSGGGGGGS